MWYIEGVEGSSVDSYTLEIVMKGVANHHRINVMLQLKNQPDMSVEELSESCRVAYKTLSVHLRSLKNAGLITKKKYSRRVEHRLTDRGVCVAEFLRTLS